MKFIIARVFPFLRGVVRFLEEKWAIDAFDMKLDAGKSLSSQMRIMQ